MNDDFLKIRLERVARRQRWFGLWRKLSACWAAAALGCVGMAWVQQQTGWVSPLTLPVLVAVALGVSVGVGVLHLTVPTDYRWLARRIEAKHPDLNGVLLTAVQTRLDRTKEPGYFEYRIIQEATAKSQEQDWRDILPTRRLVVGQAVHVGALVLFGFALSYLRIPAIHGETPKWVSVDGVSVSPGDAKVERGDSFVVLARFGGALPPGVTMVVSETNVAPRTVPLVKSLADPVYGGSLAEVNADFTYRLEYRGERTRDFKVTVYEHPRLVRSDVDLNFPDYTKLPPKHIEDTRRVSAVEGTRLDFALQLNKPVKSAKLVSRDPKQKATIDLAVSPDKAVASLPAFVPAKSGTYELQLVDDEGRANKIASNFIIDVQPNRTPEIRLTSPRGDVRPSALEEVTFDGTVWDDFGTPAYGIAYALAGAEPKFIELGKDGGPKEKRPLQHLLNLEELKAKPDDLISWFAWADDIGPDGKVRRTNGDLYFAEVRPFDEIFREAQNMEGGGGGGGGGQEQRKITELQKQIINATWKLKRDGANSGYKADVKVVLESQQQVLMQAQEAAEEARSPRQQVLWKAATTDMEKAIEQLTAASDDPGPLTAALAAEQTAYQSLLKLQGRETNVTRRNSKGGGGGGGGNQRQIDQLDLQQAENRYETQRQAQAPQNKERREQLAVMNRLQELARRQQDLNERLKELQTSLQEARTEREKEEIRKRLKRLEEEQRQMLADADEVRQRMDRAENQSNMSQQRQQLDQTREDIQKAADAAADGSVSQALASGTRAQRQLQEMRDEMRKQNSSQFADDLRQMRSEARDLATRQEQISQKLDQLAEGKQQQRKTLSDSGDRKELLDQLTEQKEKMNRLVDRATQLSEQAENSEPLLSRQLYDSIRKVSQDDANTVKQTRSELLGSGMLTRDLNDRLTKSMEREEGGRTLDLTQEMLREGYLPQARRAGQSARGAVDELKRGVERAAESVLGDDAEQLRLARSELDTLTDQLQREVAQAGGGETRKPGETGEGEQPGQRPGERDGRQAGQGNQPGQRGDGTEPGEGGQGGEGREAGKSGKSGKAGDRGQQVADRGKKGESGRGQQPGQGGQGSAPGQDGQQPGQGGTGSEPSQTAQAGGQGGGGGQDQPGGARGGREGREGDARLADGRREGGERGGADRGGLGLDRLIGGGDYRGGGLGGGEFGPVYRGPLTGEEFNRWAERLRDVEDLVDSPELRNAIAAARERARQLRRDFRQDQKKPDWAVVELQIIKPLVEVRSRVAEELARRESKDSLTPIDRDPVPNRFAESVRRYYEDLGKDK